MFLLIDKQKREARGIFVTKVYILLKVQQTFFSSAVRAYTGMCIVHIG